MKSASGSGPVNSSSGAPASRMRARPSSAARRLCVTSPTTHQYRCASPLKRPDHLPHLVPAFAFGTPFVDTPAAMSPRVRAGRHRPGWWAAGWALAWVAFLPGIGIAQVPFEQDQPRSTRGLRDRYKGPQNSQKLSDNIRKLQSEDSDERLQAISGLGEMNDPKATEYLVASANDPDARIRIKAIDTLGRIQAKEATP